MYLCYPMYNTQYPYESISLLTNVSSMDHTYSVTQWITYLSWFIKAWEAYHNKPYFYDERFYQLLNIVRELLIQNTIVESIVYLSYIYQFIYHI